MQHMQSTVCTKACFKCGAEKPLTDFYKHAGMADGHVNKCKECNKKDVRKNRSEALDHYREYDRQRGNRQGVEYLREYRERYPKKYAAHSKVNNAIAGGKLVRGCCEICGEEKTVAHHDDYDRPLDIRWLCQGHHKQWHVANGPGLNGE